MDNYAGLPVGEFFNKDETYLINGRKSNPLYDTDG